MTAEGKRRSKRQKVNAGDVGHADADPAGSGAPMDESSSSASAQNAAVSARSRRAGRRAAEASLEGAEMKDDKSGSDSDGAGDSDSDAEVPNSCAAKIMPRPQSTDEEFVGEDSVDVDGRKLYELGTLPGGWICSENSIG